MTLKKFNDRGWGRCSLLRGGSKGFTITELLLSAAIVSSVIAIGAYGLTSLIGFTMGASSQSERRIELNRALDFIASEIRHAEDIVVNASTETKPITFDPIAAVGISDAQPTLMLKADETNNVPIIYYLASAANGIWLGPKVIYRWGPPLNIDGTYLNPDDSNQWAHHPLIDLIEDNGVTPPCKASWVSAGAPGFSACVHPSGRIADISMAGRISKALSQTGTYRLNTQTTIRTANSFFSPLTPPPTGGGTLPPTGGGTLPSSCAIVMDEDSIDNGAANIQQAAASHGVSSDILVNDNRPTLGTNPPLYWNENYPGDVVTLSTGQAGDEGLFQLPGQLIGQNGPFSRDDFIAGLPSAGLDKVQGVAPMGNSDLASLVGQSCVAVVYDSDVSVNSSPPEANLMGSRLGRFYFTVLSVQSGSPGLNDITVRVDPVPTS